MNSPSLASPATAVAAEVMDLLIARRRMAVPGGDRPEDWPIQMDALLAVIADNETIDFILPAFPCKSPNPDKVAGPLPDEGERVALRALDDLCGRIGAIHPPGARVTICSDGHVFSDVVGVDDETVSAYHDELGRMIDDEGLRHVRMIDMRDIWGWETHQDMRRRIERDWAPSLSEVRTEVRTGGRTEALLKGMTRFLMDDTVGWTGTRSQLHKRSKARAYELLRRSRAWGDLLSTVAPRSVRLSIHPQTPGAAKFGIALVGDGDDVWTTPWHSVLVHDAQTGPHLRPHAQVRDSCTPVYRDGRLSHYLAP